MDKIISIDIIIPCYNVELHIEKCIMSLISQSYSKTSYYCYFINDASTDKTAEILNKYKNEQNITIIHHKQNKGLSAARNSGIKKSTSSLVAFLDGDMAVKEDWLESYLSFFNKNIVAVMGDNIPPKDAILNPIEKYYFSKARGARQFRSGSEISFQYMLYGNAMIKRKVLIKCGMFDEKINKYGGEDTDLSIRIWEKYPNQFVYSKKSSSTHFQRRTLEEFCNQMKAYGENNFLLLSERYPDYSVELGTDLINSFKGILIFNPIIKKIIKLIYLIFPFQIAIRYMVIDSVICGARSSSKIKTDK